MSTPSFYEPGEEAKGNSSAGFVILQQIILIPLLGNQSKGVNLERVQGVNRNIVEDFYKVYFNLETLRNLIVTK